MGLCGLPLTRDELSTKIMILLLEFANRYVRNSCISTRLEQVDAKRLPNSGSSAKPRLSAFNPFNPISSRDG